MTTPTVRVWKDCICGGSGGYFCEPECCGGKWIPCEICANHFADVDKAVGEVLALFDDGPANLMVACGWQGAKALEKLEAIRARTKGEKLT